MFFGVDGEEKQFGKYICSFFHLFEGRVLLIFDLEVVIVGKLEVQFIESFLVST